MRQPTLLRLCTLSQAAWLFKVAFAFANQGLCHAFPDTRAYTLYGDKVSGCCQASGAGGGSNAVIDKLMVIEVLSTYRNHLKEQGKLMKAVTVGRAL
jgi:hypothetical protein